MPHFRHIILISFDFGRRFPTASNIWLDDKSWKLRIVIGSFQSENAEKNRAKRAKTHFCIKKLVTNCITSPVNSSLTNENVCLRSCNHQRCTPFYHRQTIQLLGLSEPLRRCSRCPRARSFSPLFDDVLLPFLKNTNFLYDWKRINYFKGGCGGLHLGGLDFDGILRLTLTVSLLQILMESYR